MVCCTGLNMFSWCGVWWSWLKQRCFSYYPIQKATQNIKNIFFPPKRVPAQLNSNFLVYLSCFPGGLSLLKHDANIVVFTFGPMHETKTLYSSTMFLLTAH